MPPPHVTLHAPAARQALITQFTAAGVGARVGVNVGAGGGDADGDGVGLAVGASVGLDISVEVCSGTEAAVTSVHFCAVYGEACATCSR
jgi:hypothetical protein